MISPPRNVAAALSRFKRNPIRYLTIPVTAAGVGLVTNYIGVSMLFYPIHYTGLSIKRWPEQPFGLFGWQGVVPCKRFAMCNIMVDVTLNKLLKVSEVFEPLEPKAMANALQKSIQSALLGGWLPLPVVNQCLQRVAAEVVNKIESLVDLGDIVVTGMTTDPAILGRFFQRVGKNELEFLVHSGTYFGFVLGLVQMGVWILFPKYWTLPISGAVVGFITNWIAIKMIFEPVKPYYIGPLKVHGMFLRRQKEVSAEFSEYLANNLLTSEQMWKVILEGQNAKDFETIIRQQLPFLTSGMVQTILRTLKEKLIADTVKIEKPGDTTIAESEVVEVLCRDHELHRYIDDKIALEKLLIQRMGLLSPAEFERLLHPIFEEDELTLIAAGNIFLNSNCFI
ncbi:unnamed protein product [Ectocarpus fasciculatus]